MEKIELADAIEAARSTLIEAMARGQGQPLQFRVGPVQLEFQVGVTATADGSARLRFWVLELGGGGSYQRQTVQKMTMTLEPVEPGGQVPVQVERNLGARP